MDAVLNFTFSRVTVRFIRAVEQVPHPGKRNLNSGLSEHIPNFLQRVSLFNGLANLPGQQSGHFRARFADPFDGQTAELFSGVLYLLH